MYKWVQKEIFFLATLAFVFVATASVSSFLKNHIHHETALASTARVFWPDNQAAVFPKTPPASFFVAQKEKTQKNDADANESGIPAMAHSKIRNVVSGPYRAFRKVPRQTRPTPLTRISRKAPPNTRFIKRTGAATSAPKKVITQKPHAIKQPPKAKIDTLELRAYDVHMKWVKKTLAEYKDTSR